jgi:hypothetical protein
MTLTFVLCTQTDTIAPALACLTPALLTPLSAFRIFCLGEELKLRGPLKTILLLHQPLTHRSESCCSFPDSELGCSPNSPSFSK